MNEADLTCPNCDRIMYCKIEILLGDKFRQWYCDNCDINFRLVADKYIEFILKSDAKPYIINDEVKQ